MNQVVWNVNKLIEDLVNIKNYPKDKATLFVNSLISTIEGALINGEEVRIKNFGTFKSEWKEARESYNPATGKSELTEGRYEVIFQADERLKDQINKPFEHLNTVLLDSKDPELQETFLMEKDSDDFMDLDTSNPLHKFEEQVSEIKGLLNLINTPKDFIEDESNIDTETASINKVKPEVSVLKVTDSKIIKKHKESVHVQSTDEFGVVRDLSILMDDDEIRSSVLAEETDVEETSNENFTLSSDNLESETSIDTTKKIEEKSFEKEDENLAESTDLSKTESLNIPTEEESLSQDVSDGLKLVDVEKENLTENQKILSVEEEIKKKENEMKEAKRKKWNRVLWILLGVLLLEVLGVLAYFYKDSIFTSKQEKERNQRAQQVADSIARDLQIDEINDSLNNFVTDEQLDSTLIVVQEHKSEAVSNETVSSVEIDQKNENKHNETVQIAENQTLEELFNKPRDYKEIIATEKMIAGSQLTKFAKQYYGHPNFWVYIYEANKSKISNPDNVPTGIDIKIPKMDKRLVDSSNRESLEFALQLQKQYLK